MSLRYAACATLLFAVAALGACSDESADPDGSQDSADVQACERWDALQNAGLDEQAAVAELNSIADQAEDRQVRAKALALAVIVESGAAPAELGTADEEMDAACTAAT